MSTSATLVAGFVIQGSVSVIVSPVIVLTRLLVSFGSLFTRITVSEGMPWTIVFVVDEVVVVAVTPMATVGVQPSGQAYTGNRKAAGSPTHNGIIRC